MTANNTMVAKLAAALAVVGLVASSVVAFAPAAGAQTTTTSASVTFTRDLTIGSTGADVTALQNWLIMKGYAIAAGATGYFGAQTQAALAKYQAAKSIAPAAGYFGPITRAAVAADGGSTGGNNGGSTGGNNGGSDLSGGEADLSDYNLRREESTGDEGEEEVEVATAEFDVEDGDVRVERLEILASSTNNLLEQNPWNYFDRVIVWADGEEIADMEVDDRDAWDEESDDVYRLALTGLDYVVEEGNQAEITFGFDIAGSIDSDDQAQTFVFQIPEDGIRAVDAEGIQQYIGATGELPTNTNESVSFTFGAEDNGELSISSNSDDPDASILIVDDEDESDEYSVFVFDIENDSDVDSLVTEVQIDVTDGNSAVATGDIIRRATLVVDGDEYDAEIAGAVSAVGTLTFEDMDLEVSGDDEVTAELMITLARNATSTTLSFETDGATDVEAEGVDSGDETTVDGSATSATHTTALTGIAVEAVSTSQSVTTPGDTASSTYATYTIKFDVTALDEDAYITEAVGTIGTSTTNGVEYDIFGGSYTGTASAVLTSTAVDTGSYFRVDEGETETFTLTVTLDPAAAGTFGVKLDEVNFNDTQAAGDTTFNVDASNEDFRTDAVYIAN
ncbi:MAG TPA: peptidoglycan-binding protein [Candidatus Paceibacterota bacterium]